MLITELIPDYKRSTYNTGNMYISGLSSMGAEDCMVELMNNTMSDGNPVFYFDSTLSRKKRFEIEKISRENSYSIININTKMCSSININMLYLFKSIDEMSEAIYVLLYDNKDEIERINQFCRYFKDCILVLKEKKTRYTVKDILSLSVDYVRENIMLVSTISELEKEDERSFLESRDTYSNWGIINDRTRKLLAIGIIDALSGSLNPYDFFKGKMLLIINKPIEYTDYQNIYNCIQNVFINILSKVCQDKNISNKDYHIFINSSIKINTSLLMTLLDVARDSLVHLPICVYDQNISEAIRAHSTAILDYYGGFCVFKNNEGDFWSGFFGTMLMPDRTDTFSKKRKSVFINAGGVVPRNLGKYQATTIHRIEKPLFESRVFQSLKEKVVIYYDVYSNRKTKKQLRW